MGQNISTSRDDVPPPGMHKIRGLGLTDMDAGRKRDIMKIVRIVSDAAGRLDFQIRENYINVYFRGGCIWKIGGVAPKSWGLSFFTEMKYFKRPNSDQLDSSWLPESRGGVDKWNSVRTRLETVMEGWFNIHPKEERDLQHKCAFNHVINTSSNWIIVDIEYAAWLHGKKCNKGALNCRRLCKIDMVAFQRSSLMQSGAIPLYIIEFKVGGGAVTGTSGVISHAQDIHQFLCNRADHNARNAFLESMKNIVREKLSLGLLPEVPINILKRKFVCRPAFVLKDAPLPDQVTDAINKTLKSCSDNNLWLEFDSFVSSAKV